MTTHEGAPVRNNLLQFLRSEEASPRGEVQKEDQILTQKKNGEQNKIYLLKPLNKKTAQ